MHDPETEVEINNARPRDTGNTKHKTKTNKTQH